MESKTEYGERPWLKFYLEGGPANADAPDKSVPQVFDEAAEKWGDKNALIFYGAKISYRQLKEQIDRFATALGDLGVKKGDKVALLLLKLNIKLKTVGLRLLSARIFFMTMLKRQGLN